MKKIKNIMYIGAGLLLFLIMACEEPKAVVITAENVDINGTYEYIVTNQSSPFVMQYKLKRSEGNIVTGKYWQRSPLDKDHVDYRKTEQVADLFAILKNVGTKIELELTFTFLDSTKPRSHVYQVLDNGNKITIDNGSDGVLSFIKR